MTDAARVRGLAELLRRLDPTLSEAVALQRAAYRYARLVVTIRETGGFPVGPGVRLRCDTPDAPFSEQAIWTLESAE
ncbi:MAG: hypothetical protein ACI8RZ_003783 [Myxococcota bacterium]|jgi:hypothetical protein